jgi:hypothetical protein
LFKIVRVALGGVEQKQPAFVRVSITVSFPSAEASRIVFKATVAVDCPAGIVTLEGRATKSVPELAVPET